MFDRVSFEREVGILAAAAEASGLDFLDIDFLLCPPEIIAFVAAYSLPTRFSHWGFGKGFMRLLLQHRHGLARIHELVCFSDPCQAFLSENNTRVENLLVAAHVIAHCDFFKHNIYFAKARRDALDLMAWNSGFIQHCVQVYGLDAVEQVLDAALALRCYSDILSYIARNSDSLKDWQRQIVEIVIEESRYFLPLMQTKLLNEGWAAYWHARLMDAVHLTEAEAVEFAILNAQALETNTSHINPYRLGVEMFSQIRSRAGDEVLFHIRREENDLSFFRRYGDEDLIAHLGLAVYSGPRGSYRQLEAAPGEVKAYLLRSLDNCGLPRIIIDKGYTAGGKLFLRHIFDGRPLNTYAARKTLELVYNLWGGSTALHTQIRGEQVVFAYDDKGHSRGGL